MLASRSACLVYCPCHLSDTGLRLVKRSQALFEHIDSSLITSYIRDTAGVVGSIPIDGHSKDPEHNATCGPLKVRYQEGIIAKEDGRIRAGFQAGSSTLFCQHSPTRHLANFTQFVESNSGPKGDLNGRSHDCSWISTSKRSSHFQRARPHCGSAMPDSSAEEAASDTGKSGCGAFCGTARL